MTIMLVVYFPVNFSLGILKFFNIYTSVVKNFLNAWDGMKKKKKKGNLWEKIRGKKQYFTSEKKVYFLRKQSFLMF